MASSIQPRLVEVGDTPVNLRTENSNGLAFVVVSGDTIAHVKESDDVFSAGIPFAVGAWSPGFELTSRDEVWVVCDTGNSAVVGVEEVGV